MLPVVAVFLGWIVLAEVPTGAQLGGMLIALAGVALTRLPGGTREDGAAL
jgi:drug/metabolite transporter (DMT)-like permease